MLSLRHLKEYSIFFRAANRFFCTENVTGNESAKQNAPRRREDDPKKQLFVSFIPQEWADVDVKNYLSKYNPNITQVVLLKNKITGENTGRCIIKMQDEESTESLYQSFTDNYIETGSQSERVVIRRWRSTSNQNSNSAQNKLFMASIPYEASEEEIVSFCKSFNENVTVRVPKWPEQEKNKGYAFISFENEDDARSFYEVVDGKEFKGRNVRITFHQDQVRRRSTGRRNSDERDEMDNSQRYNSLKREDFTKQI